MADLPKQIAQKSLMPVANVLMFLLVILFSSKNVFVESIPSVAAAVVALGLSFVVVQAIRFDGVFPIQKGFSKLVRHWSLVLSVAMFAAIVANRYVVFVLPEAITAANITMIASVGVAASLYEIAR